VIVKTEFTVDAPLEVVWRYLLDIPKIAHCVPGAELTEVIDDRTFGGKIGVKLGPIDLGYRGRISIEEVDEGSHTVRAKAEGSELRGRGGASAILTSKIYTDDSGRTAVTMETELGVSGIVAQFGRSGIVQEVSQRLAQRFAACLEQDLKASA
jgi:carbon monoxide dehydrogenase subunit G